MPGYTLFDVKKGDVKQVMDALRNEDFFGVTLRPEMASDRDYSSDSGKRKRGKGGKGDKGDKGGKFGKPGRGGDRGYGRDFGRDFDRDFDREPKEFKSRKKDKKDKKWEKEKKSSSKPKYDGNSTSLYKRRERRNETDRMWHGNAFPTVPDRHGIVGRLASAGFSR